MPSFDIVSKVDMQEVSNAVNQSTKEIEQRYDFKGSKCSLNLEKDGIRLLADDEHKLKAVVDILQSKLIKRKISLKAIQYGRIEPAAGGTVKQVASIQQGVPTEKGKEIVALLKRSKIKVQGQIQEEQVRVSGKNRDDLQEAIALVREQDFGLDLQFSNFRE
jgi:uncharacterized protein YajQ (UPF0234 family)